MKTFNFTIQLDDKEISNMFSFLAYRGNVSQEADPVQAVHSFISSKLQQMYLDVSGEIVSMQTQIMLAQASTAIQPKEIVSIVTDADGTEIKFAEAVVATEPLKVDEGKLVSYDVSPSELDTVIHDEVETTEEELAV